MFNSLDDPNTNKIKQDHSIVLDWFQDSSNPSQSKLVELLNLRATLAVGQPVVVFRDFFASEVVYGKSIVQAIFENTRHRPRDFIHAIKAIQQQASTQKVVGPQVEAGLKQYAKGYFIPEVKNELSGFLKKEEIAYAFALLQSLHKRRFTYAELTKAHKALLKDGLKFELDPIIRALYETSVLGNTFVDETSGKEYVKFRYRNPHSDFNPNENVLLHYALARGLNIPIATGQQYA